MIYGHDCQSDGLEARSAVGYLPGEMGLYPDLTGRELLDFLGGLNRPIPATLGGFSIGFAFGLLGGILPTNQSQYLPSFIFAAVIVVLLVRPDGLFTRATGAVERV